MMVIVQVQKTLKDKTASLYRPPAGKASRKGGKERQTISKR